MKKLIKLYEILLRDYFASQAMKYFVEAYGEGEGCAKLSYDQADEMLMERNYRRKEREQS